MADLSAVDIVQVVYSLRSGVTNLKKTATVRGRGINLSGPCPVCKGNDRFYVLPDAEDTSGKRRGKWACRNCHPKEGDAIELLTFMEGISEKDAFARLKEMFPEMSGAQYTKTPGRTRVNLDAERKYRVKPLPENAIPPSVQWQKRARQIIESAIARLWDDTGAEARAYLLSRGLTEKTIRAAKLGFIPLAKSGQDIMDKAALWGIDDREDMILPSGILFPYEYKGDIWKLRIRRLGNVAKDERYRIIPGSSNGLYRADALAPGRPLAAFEGEIDALSAYQSIGDDMACIAFGSTMHARIPTWTIRLALASEVLLCFDNEIEETKTSGAADYWTSRLENARVYQIPEAYHDCNDMLQRQGDIQQWLLDGLRSNSPGVQVKTERPLSCLFAGCRSVQIDTAFQWCETHVTSGLFMDTGKEIGYPSLPGIKSGYEAWLETARNSSPGRLDELHTLIDRQALPEIPEIPEIPESVSLSIAHQMKDAIERLSDKACTLRVLPIGFTLEQRIEELRQEDARLERKTIGDICQRRRRHVYERAISSQQALSKRANKEK